MVSLKDIKQDEEIKALIKQGNDNLGLLGFTDHSSIHCEVVVKQSAQILRKLGYDKETIELAKIASYMHDIGNAINRKKHAEYGGILANEILKRYDISTPNRIRIASAISNHDESTGGAIDPISAALIIADKTDVRRDRVRDKTKGNFDIHDRVNYAVTKSNLTVDKEKKTITLDLELDEKICTMLEYFDIFLGRMMMCRRAAELLGYKFKQKANGDKIQ